MNYTMDELASELKTLIGKHFPGSLVNIREGVRGGLFVRFYLANSPKDVMGNIIDNDPINNFFIIFFEDLETLPNKDKLIKGKIVMDNSSSTGFLAKTSSTNRSLVRTYIPFKRTQGQVSEVLKVFNNYLNELRKEILLKADLLEVDFDVRKRLPSVNITYNPKGNIPKKPVTTSYKSKRSVRTLEHTLVEGILKSLE